jgi:FkbM family methyltransferase
MHIVSYAQNFEDVLLWRALQHVRHGVYVDIGAQDPIIDSVSRAFYEQGWRGVHVEPTAQYAELLRQDRPDEVVIQAAVSDRSGLMELYVIPNTGQSTGSKRIAEHAGRHGYEATQTKVTAVTLDEVFASIDSAEIHWLKIDVEGFERRVLNGWRDSPLRPWIVLVEATRPLTQVKTHAAWEPLLRAKGYTFVHFDGVNRYYLSPAHRELKQHFRHGPCIWDEYQLPKGSSRTGLLGQQHNAAINQLRAEVEARVAQQSEDVARAQTCQHPWSG